MNQSVEVRATHSVPSPSDSRLARIAALAALEFDRASRGLTVDFEAAPVLAEFLQASFETSGECTPMSVRNLDGGTVVVVGRSLGSTPTTIADVISRALTVARDMSSTSTESPLESLTNLRDFCAALSTNLVSYRETLREPRPTSRYRR